MELRPRRNRRSVPGDNYPAKKNRRSVKKDTIRSLTELPVEVQSEILVRLPAKSLLFCKCVCKSLRTLISDPNFVESHLNRFNSPQKSLILDYDLGKRLLHYTSSRNPRKLSSLSLTPLLPKITDDKYHSVYIVGSCNGLIVFAVWFGTSENDSVYIFWNPVIGQHRYLPKSNCTWFGVHGLGFIPETNGYVVLKVWQTENVMDLYRTSTDSWTTIDCSSRGADLVSKVGHFVTPLFFNGAFHWASQTIDDTDIAYYNLKDKEFGVIKAINPNGFDGYRGFLVYKKVVVVDGSLAMIYWVMGHVFPFEMWVMNDYVVEETWTRRFLIRQDASDYVGRNLGGLWTSGLMVINEVGKRGKRKDYKFFTTFVLYDLNTGSRMNIARVEEMRQFTKVHNFVETLVPVVKAESLAQ